MFKKISLNRRKFLTGLTLAGIPGLAKGFAPETTPLPLPRPGGGKAIGHPGLEQLVAEAKLGGKVSCVVADARTGEVLEGLRPVLAQPPASVAKAITSLYALEALGPGYRFRTRVIATGPVQGGIVQGDIALVGGGDPLLNTDNLFVLARKLKDAGVRGATGKFIVHGGGLPVIDQIDAAQPAHVGYNPAVSGLILNFNRVYFEWKRDGNGYSVVMDARSEKLRPRVSVARMKIVDRKSPTYTYARRNGRDEWSVARGALGKGGGRWLPVRDPLNYAGEVFRSLARSHGIELKKAKAASGAVPRGTVLSEHVSVDLTHVIKGMLKYSTNITAEVLGLMATAKRGKTPSSLKASANEMSHWLSQRLRAKRPKFVDHSGLGDASRITSHDMVRALTEVGVDGPLIRLMKQISMKDAAGKVDKSHPLKVFAKTGTLNFVSALAGYVRTPDGRQLAFAIFSSDTNRRASLSRAQRDRPEGGRAWTRRARRMQQRMLERWADVFGVV